MPLKLTRPICSLDLESTGTDVNVDRIVQIAVIKIFHDGRPREEKVRYINPEMPIPEGSTLVHGITDEMVKDQPPFRNISKGLYEFIKGCDFITYNGNNFDIPMLYNEFLRAGVLWNVEDIAFIDACQIFKIKEARTLEAAVAFYCGEQHVNQHDAKYDALATIEVLDGQLEMYGDIAELSVEDLAIFSNYGNRRADIHGKFYVNDKNEYVINVGQNRGKLAKDNIGFIEWMLKPDKTFSPDTIRICNIIMNEYKKSKSNG